MNINSAHIKENLLDTPSNLNYKAMLSDYKDNDNVGRKSSKPDLFSSDWNSWGEDLTKKSKSSAFESNTDRNWSSWIEEEKPFKSLKSNINSNSKVDAAGTSSVGRLILSKNPEKKTATDEWSDW